MKKWVVVVLVLLLVSIAIVLVPAYFRHQDMLQGVREHLTGTTSSTGSNTISVDTLKPANTNSQSIASNVTTNTSGSVITVAGSNLPPPLPQNTSIIANIPADAPALTPEEQAAAAVAATAGKCLPADGQSWSVPSGTRGSTLASPCCQAPGFELLDKTYATCATNTGKGPISSCLNDCCSSCGADAAKYDPTWYQMCMCGCALCCNNSSDPHFAKHETCSKYIEAEPGSVSANETIGVYTPTNWRGFITAFKGIRR